MILFFFSPREICCNDAIERHYKVVVGFNKWRLPKDRCGYLSRVQIRGKIVRDWCCSVKENTTRNTRWLCTDKCPPVHVKKRGKLGCQKDIFFFFMDVYFQKPKEDQRISGFPKPRCKLFVRHIVSLFGVYRFGMPPRRAELSHTSSILPRFLLENENRVKIIIKNKTKQPLKLPNACIRNL